MRWQSGETSLWWSLNQMEKYNFGLYPTRLNQTLIRPIHRDLTVNDIFQKLPKVMHMCYLIVLDTSSGCNNLKLDEILLFNYIWMQIWEIQVCKITIETTVTGVMFQKKIDEIFKELPDVFGTSDDIWIVGYDDDGTDHIRTVHAVLYTLTEMPLPKYEK